MLPLVRVKLEKVSEFSAVMDVVMEIIEDERGDAQFGPAVDLLLCEEKPLTPLEVSSADELPRSSLPDRACRKLGMAVRPEKKSRTMNAVQHKGMFS